MEKVKSTKLPAPKYLVPGNSWSSRHWYYYAVKVAGYAGSFGRACIDTLMIVDAMTKNTPKAMLTWDYLADFCFCSRDKIRRVVNTLVADGLILRETFAAKASSSAESHSDTQKHCVYAINFDNDCIKAGLAFDRAELESLGRDVTSNIVAQADAQLEEITSENSKLSDIDYVDAKMRVLEAARAALLADNGGEVDAPESSPDASLAPAENKSASKPVVSEKTPEDANQDTDKLAAVDLKRPAKQGRKYKQELYFAWHRAQEETGAGIEEAVAAYKLYVKESRFNEPDGPLPSFATAMAAWLGSPTGLTMWLDRYRKSTGPSANLIKDLPPTTTCPYCGLDMHHIEGTNLYASCPNGCGTFEATELARIKKAKSEGRL